jgi:thiamine monophosphate kinase
MTERELIARILPGCERSPAQRNRPFEADAELLDLNGALWAVTTDEFSGAEDRFTGEDLPHLGANLVVATLSDLLAVGASPRFLLQALVLPREGSEAFACGLLEGVRQALAQTEECHLCGGDLGTAADWRWCGTALGPCPKPITRCFPAGTEVATLWVSGSVGDANLAAFTGNPPPRTCLYRHQRRAGGRSLGTASPEPRVPV